MTLAARGLEYKYQPQNLAMHIRNEQPFTASDSEECHRKIGIQVVKKALADFPTNARQGLFEKYIYHFEALWARVPATDLGDELAVARCSRQITYRGARVESALTHLSGLGIALRYACWRAHQP